MNREEVAEAIKVKLKEKDIDFEEAVGDDSILIKTGMESDFFDSYRVLISIQGDVQVSFFPPMKIKRDRIPLVCEVMMRINYALRIGKVVMDFEDGEFHFEYIKEFSAFGENLEEALMEMMHVPCLAMDAIVPECVAVMSRAKNPDRAAKDYEKAIDEQLENAANEETTERDVKKGDLDVEDYIENRGDWNPSSATDLWRTGTM